MRRRGEVSSPPLPRRRAMLAGIVVVLAVAGLLLGTRTDRWLRDDRQPAPDSDPRSTPTSAPAPSPVAGVGTPVTRDGLVVVLATVPSRVGLGHVTLRVREVAGTPVDDAIVTVWVDMPAMAMGVPSVLATWSGNGEYRVTAPVTMVGSWQLVAVIDRGEESPVVVTFVIVIGP